MQVKGNEAIISSTPANIFACAVVGGVLLLLWLEPIMNWLGFAAS
jgi:hypothetical protein